MEGYTTEIYKRALWDDAPIGIAYINKGGRFLECNAAYCTITGYSESELKARTWQSITHPEDLEMDNAEAKRLSTDLNRDGYSMVKRYLRKDGRIAWVELSVVALRTENVFTHFVVHAAPIPTPGAGTDVTTRTQQIPTISQKDILDRLCAFVRLNPRVSLVATTVIIAAIKAIDIDAFFIAFRDILKHLAG